MLPNEDMEVFSEDNFCQRSNQLQTKAELYFLNTTTLAGEHKHTKISIGFEFLEGSNVYNFNKPIIFHFNILGEKVTIGSDPDNGLYDSIYNVTLIGYQVFFDNAAIVGTIQNIQHTVFNASSCFSSVNMTYQTDGQFVIDVVPNQCEIPNTKVDISLIVRYKDAYATFDIASVMADFDFIATMQYKPDSSFDFDGKWQDIVQAYLADRSI